jgi:hypothetical protein
MEEKKENQFIDADRSLDAYEERIELYKPSPEALEEFVEAAKLDSGCQLLMKELREQHSKSPKLPAGDIDAAWDQADVGEETVGGSTPTPDQDVVDQLGVAVGRSSKPGRRIASWPSLKTDVRNAGGEWVDQEAVVDGALVTSRKPDDIPAFNREMINLFGKARQQTRQAA